MGARRGTAFCVLGALSLGACAHGSAGKESPEAKAAKKGQVLVGPEAFEGGEVHLATWLGYGVAKAALYDKPRPVTANDSADDFDLELGGRTAQSAFWEEHRKDPEAKPWPELDRQVEIWRAGFLPELVISIHARPGWTIPAKAIEGLRLEEFAQRFQGDYTPGAPVAVAGANGQRFAAVPGGDFPDPATLPYGPASCGRARDARRAAWARWAALEPRLGGAALGAESTLDFASQLIAAKRDPQRTARGATWVSDRVAYLAMLEGFCAVEAQDWRLAHTMLTRAVSMRPAHPSPRLELSLTLLQMGKTAEALAGVDTVIATSDDACAVARASRQRGYILIELGELEPARAAYRKSLEIEPGNAIALGELETIAAGLDKKAPSHDPRGFVPPPPLGIVVTKCQRPKAAP